VKQLQGFVPSATDAQTIQEYLTNNDPTKLPEAEKFSLSLSKVPQIELRLQAFKFKLSYTPIKSEIKPDLELMRTACTEVMKAKGLFKVMEIVLELGNFLNAKTPRGDAFGYSLNSLTKLVDTKSTDLTQNLLHYLISLLQKHGREFLHFAEDIPSIAAASKIALPSISENLKILTSEYTNVSKALESVQAPGKGDNFAAQMKKIFKRS